MNKKLIILLLIIITIILVNVSPCLAQDNDTPSLPNLKNSQNIMSGAGGKIGYKTNAGLETTIGQIIRVALSFLGIFFLIIIIMGGYQWMTAGGNEEAIANAKKRIINGVIGLAIVLMAYAITYFVTYYLLESTGYNPASPQS